MAIPYTVFANGTVAPSLREGWAKDEAELDDLINRDIEYAVIGPHPNPVTGYAPVDEYDLKKFTRAMIEREYTLYDQIEVLLNAILSGDLEEAKKLKAHIDKMKAAGRRLRQKRPLPEDYRNPEHWT